MNFNKRQLSLQYLYKHDSYIKTEHQLQQEIRKKYDRFKKCASLSISSDKNKRKIISVSKSFKNYKNDIPSKTKQKVLGENRKMPENSFSNMKGQNNKTRRLFLQSKKKENNFLNPCQFNFLVSFILKLEEFVKIKLDKIFLKEYLGFIDQVGATPNPNEFESLINRYFSAVNSCDSRKFGIQEKNIRSQYTHLQKQISSATATLKEKIIKISLLNKKIQKLQFKLKDEASKTHSVSDASTNTQPFDAAKDLQLLKMQKEIIIYKGRHKEFVNAFVLLQKCGVNVPKIFQDGEKAVFDEEGSKQFYSVIDKMVQRKEMKQRKYNDIALNEECDADESIVLSADAISFRFEGEEREAEQYEIKRPCPKSKPLSQALQKQLRLDLKSYSQEYQDIPSDATA